MCKCQGCGAVLQNKDPNLEGYTPKLIEGETLLCQRCFRLLHYGEFKKVNISQETFDDIFKEIRKKDCNVLYIVDCFNIYGSLIENINSLVGKNKVSIVLNKIDLLPELSNKRILNYAMKVLDEHHINYENIYMCSSLKKYYIDNIIDELKTYKKDIYVIGRSNAGKSSFINALNNAINIDKKMVESYYAGTTLKLVKVPFQNHFIYDTPGMDNSSSIYDYLDLKNLRKVLIQEEIKPISMSVYPNDVLCIGGVGYLKFDIKEKTNIILYGSRYIKYHKTNSADIENKFVKFKEENTTFPKLNVDLEMKKDVFMIDSERKSMIINGLCWIDMIRMNGKIETYLPSVLGKYVVNSLFGGK